MSHNDPEVAAKQYVIADFDLMWCEKYLVAYIELLRRPNSADEDIWTLGRSRAFPGDFNFLDILARSLVASIVTSYCRPWSKTRGSRGKRIRLPNTIFRDLAKVQRRDDEAQRLLPFNHGIHDLVLQARDKVVAHSDPLAWEFTLRSERHVIESEIRDPFHYLSLEEARALLENTQSLRAQLDVYQREARSRVGGLNP